MKTILLLLLVFVAGANAQQIYIHPDKGNGWLDSTLTFYPGRDGEGYVTPQINLTTGQLSQEALADFSVIVGYFVQLGGGAWDATLVIAEPAGQVIATPAVMNGEEILEQAVLRDVVSFAVTVERAGDKAPKTDVMTTEELPEIVRQSALEMWAYVLAQD
jgi:hypothetical protein